MADLRRNTFIGALTDKDRLPLGAGPMIFEYPVAGGVDVSVTTLHHGTYVLTVSTKRELEQLANAIARARPVDHEDESDRVNGA